MATTCRYTPCEEDAAEEVEVYGETRHYCRAHAREARSWTRKNYLGRHT